MLETLSIRHYTRYTYTVRENVVGAVNQQERSRNPGKSSETIRQTPVRQKVLKAYLSGAMHDGWIRKSDQRYRIAQKGTDWLEVIQKLLAQLEYRSWIYREGKTRNVFILESVASIFRESFDPLTLTIKEERIAYLRGFFDAEGGIPRSLLSKRYIQLVQKDKPKIAMLKEWLNEIGITTGKIHNPSTQVDSDYWRIFVNGHSILTFVSEIGSWHPRKRAIFDQWMKI